MVVRVSSVSISEDVRRVDNVRLPGSAHGRRPCVDVAQQLLAPAEKAHCLIKELGEWDPVVRPVCCQPPGFCTNRHNVNDVVDNVDIGSVRVNLCHEFDLHGFGVFAVQQLPSEKTVVGAAPECLWRTTVDLVCAARSEDVADSVAVGTQGLMLALAEVDGLSRC